MLISGFSMFLQYYSFYFIRYKPYIRKSCEEIVKTSGKDIAHILVDKNKEVDTEIMNCILYTKNNNNRFNTCCLYGFKSSLYCKILEFRCSFCKFTM